MLASEGRSGRVRVNLTVKLASAVVASFAAFVALFSYLSMREHRRHSEDLVVQSAGTEGGERSYPALGFTDKPPRWFPDGNTLLAYSVALRPEEPAGGTFYRLDLASRRFTPLFPRDTDAHERSVVGSLTPDGLAVFLSARPKSSGPWRDIVRVDIKTGRETHVLALPSGGLLDTGLKDLGLAVSPDGRTLAIMAFSDESRRGSRIWTVGVDGTGFRAITDPFPAWGTADLMDWTPDGASILFVSTEPSGDWRVMRVGREGGVAVPDGLTSMALMERDPLSRLARAQPWTMHLSPDGSRLLFGIPAKSTTELRALDLGQSRVR